MSFCEKQGLELQSIDMLFVPPSQHYHNVKLVFVKKDSEFWGRLQPFGDSFLFQIQLHQFFASLSERLFPSKAPAHFLVLKQYPGK